MPDPIHLDGLDGANPLGFLAALGALALADRIWPGSTMAWRPHANSYRPTLQSRTSDPTELAERLVAFVKDELVHSPAWAASDIIGDWTRPSFRAVLTASLRNGDTRSARLLSGFASDVIPKDEKDGTGSVKETSLSHANGQGQQKLLKFYRDMVDMVDADSLAASMSARWRYLHAKPRFRWDPADGRNFSVGVGSANTEPAGVEIAANLLAFNAIELLPCFPTASGLTTTGYARLTPPTQTRASDYLTWPIWAHPVSKDVVGGLLNLRELATPAPDSRKLTAMGVLAAVRTKRTVDAQKNLFFSEAVVC